MQQSGRFIRQRVDVLPVEIGDGLLGARGDGIVERDQFVERPIQPRGVPLGARGQRLVCDVRFDFGEGLRQRISHCHCFPSPDW